jgi:hypothetical protein
MGEAVHVLHALRAPQALFDVLKPRRLLNEASTCPFERGRRCLPRGRTERAAQSPNSRQSFSFSSTSYFVAAFRMRPNAVSRSASVTPST